MSYCHTDGHWTRWTRWTRWTQSSDNYSQVNFLHERMFGMMNVFKTNIQLGVFSSVLVQLKFF